MAVVTLAEAKSFLRITGTDSDAVLPGFIAAAQASIEQRVGYLEATAVTARVDGCRDSLTLPRTPVISLTTVTPSDGGAALTVGNLFVNPGGSVVNNDGSSFGGRYYTVVYQAGRASCPADLKQAVLELIRHDWMSQRGSARQSTQQSTETANTVPGAAFLFPFAVEQRIAPHTQPGFA